MKRKLLFALLAIVLIGAGFTAGYLTCAHRLRAFTYYYVTETYFHPNGSTRHIVHFRNKVDDFLLFTKGAKHGVETTYDEDGKVVETGEWVDGKPWSGRCWIPALGDAGSWGGLGSYHTFKDGVQID